MTPSNNFAVAILVLYTLLSPATALPQSLGINLNDTGKSIVVTADDKHFTTYDYTSHAKPIFYPLYGPQQISMTRNFPMKNVDGEQPDHPHHKSMWFGHEINDIDFWSEKGGKVKLTDISIDNGNASLTAKHNWLAVDSTEPIMTDKLTANFLQKPNARMIDLKIDFVAGDQALHFVDTKEGFFALRVHPNLRGKPVNNSGTRGSMTNSAGQSGQNIWGKKARWVDYSGTIQNTECGITVFDHPDNLRHPTTWHARDYGLLAANPFGQHYFQKKPRGAGKFILKKGDSIAFRYRVLLHTGIWGKVDLEQTFRDFASGKK